MTELGDDLVRIGSDTLNRTAREIEAELATVQLRESTGRWRRGDNDYVEAMTIEIGDESNWYVMRMPHAWDLCVVARDRNGWDEHVQDYTDVREALRDLVAREVAMRVGEIL